MADKKEQQEGKQMTAAEAAEILRKTERAFAIAAEVYKEPLTKLAESMQAGKEAINGLLSSETFQKTATIDSQLQNFMLHLLQSTNALNTQLYKNITKILLHHDLLEAELKKPEYEGLDTEQLEDLAEDPAADPRYKLLWQQAQNNALTALEKKLAEQDSTENTRPLLQSIKTKSHTMPNNALMNKLQSAAAINAGAFDLIVSNATKRRKEITAYTMITFDPSNTDLQFVNNSLTEYERQVSDAVVSLWMEAERKDIPPIFTVDMIFRAMPGGGDKPSDLQKKAIVAAMEKFRRLHVYVDATEEMQKRGKIKKNEYAKFDDYYISAGRGEFGVKKGGQSVHAYQLHTEPIILKYCKMTGQYLTVPAKYIAIEKVKNNKATGQLLAMTPERQAVTGYLLRRIAVMKRDEEQARDKKRSYDRKRGKNPEQYPQKTLAKFREQSRTIAFEALFHDVGIVTTNRDKLMDIRKFCFQVLDYQKALANIQDYQKQTQGRSITGIDIVI